MALIGNKVAERDLKRWLDANGFFAGSAKVSSLELVAITRPGWVQMFRFAVDAKSRDDETWRTLRGLLRDDDREGHEVRLYTDDEAVDDGLREWSEGMLLTRRARRPEERKADESALPITGFFVALVAVAAFVAVWAR